MQLLFFRNGYVDHVLGTESVTETKCSKSPEVNEFETIAMVYLSSSCFNERDRALVFNERDRELVFNERDRELVFNERDRALVFNERDRALVFNERDRALVLMKETELLF